MSSVSSLNHLTVKGGVPLNVPLKRTVVLGRAAWDSSSVTKLGGSEENKTDQVKEVLTLVRDYRTDRPGLHCLTFNHDGSTAFTTSCCVGQFAQVRSCVGSLQLFDFNGHRVVLLNEFVLHTTRDSGPVFLPVHRDGEGTGYFATNLNKGPQNLVHVYQRFDEAGGNDLFCHQKEQ